VIKRPNLRIPGVEEGAEIQTKSIENLLNEIIAESFPTLCNVIDTQEAGISNSNRHE
jgi:hypothetical protein